MKKPSRSRAVMVVLEALIALAFVFAVLGTFSKLAGAEERCATTRTYRLQQHAVKGIHYKPGILTRSRKAPR